MTIALAPPEHLAKAIGYYGAANLAMNAVAPAVAEAVAERFGFMPVFALAAGSGLVGFVLTRTLPRGGADSRTPGVGLYALMARPSSMWMIAIGTLWGVAFSAMFVFHQPFALTLGITRVKGFFIAYTFAALFARIGTGALADRVGCYRVALGSFALYAATVLAMRHLEPGWLEPIGAFFGFAHGLFFPAYTALIVGRVSEGDRAKLMAVSNGVFNAGFAVGSMLLGMLAETGGYRRMYTVAGLASFTVVAMLIAEGRLGKRMALSAS